MDLLLIGGLSGSGKNVALGALEDSGYYTVNNLPLPLVAATADHLARAGRTRVAMALDVKTGPGLAGLAETIAKLKAAGWEVRFFYLDATTPELVKRFSETRRPDAHRGDRARTHAARGRPAARLHVRHDRAAGRGAAQLGQGFRQRRCVAADAALRIVRLQARNPARRRSRLRRALPAEPALRAGAAGADRPRRGRRRVPRADAGGRAHVQRHLPLRRQLAARLCARQPQLSHGRHRLHRRAAPLGLLRRAARPGVLPALPGADAAPRAGLRRCPGRSRSRSPAPPGCPTGCGCSKRCSPPIAACGSAIRPPRRSSRSRNATSCCRRSRARRRARSPRASVRARARSWSTATRTGWRRSPRARTAPTRWRSARA